jgi:hypothetical protein
MKRWILLIGFIGLFGSKSWAASQSSSMRSSWTITSEANAVLFSSSVLFYGVNIGSGAALSSLTVFSTGTVVPLSSTHTFYSTHQQASFLNEKPMLLPRGLSYTKVGAAPVTIYWEPYIRQ